VHKPLFLQEDYLRMLTPDHARIVLNDDVSTPRLQINLANIKMLLFFVQIIKASLTQSNLYILNGLEKMYVMFSRRPMDASPLPA